LAALRTARLETVLSAGVDDDLKHVLNLALKVFQAKARNFRLGKSTESSVC